MPRVGAQNQGHHSWDEGNSNQEPCTSGNGGMRGVTLPPCGELPLETHGETWLTDKCQDARTSPHCCMPMAGRALVPLLGPNGPLHAAVTPPPRGEAQEHHARPGGPMHGQHYPIAPVRGFADLVLKVSYRSFRCEPRIWS